MKKMIIFACFIMVSLSASSVLAAKPVPEHKTEVSTVLANKEKLTDEEIAALKKRVEEIRNMDKSNLSSAEKKELRKELRTIKERVKRDGGYVYIGGTTLLLLIILLIILI